MIDWDAEPKVSCVNEITRLNTRIKELEKALYFYATEAFKNGTACMDDECCGCCYDATEEGEKYGPLKAKIALGID